jgi:hypothetical protein
MGYKLLGFAVWRGGKWYVRRRIKGARGKVAVGAVGAAVVTGLILAARQAQAANR